MISKGRSATSLILNGGGGAQREALRQSETPRVRQIVAVHTVRK